jgi:hypothetical protein
LRSEEAMVYLYKRDRERNSLGGNDRLARTNEESVEIERRLRSGIGLLRWRIE